MAQAITQHDRDEYEEVSTKLSLAAREFPPLFIAETFDSWFAEDGPLAELRLEHDKYQFGPVNYVIRHLLAHFLAFQQDTLHTPEFYCWPGAWMAGEQVSERGMSLFERQGALFVDKEEDDSVFPRLQSGREEAVVHKAFDDFYHNTVVYDLTNQWIAEQGPFRYEIGWLVASASAEEAKVYLRRKFRAAFGLDPEDAQVLEK